MNFGTYPRSSSLFSSCFDLDDNIDTDIYFSILEEEDVEDEKTTEQIRKRLQLQLLLCSRIEDKNHQREKKKKRRKKVTLQYMDDDGNLCTMTPTKTFWYIYYIRNGNEMDTRAKAKYCRHFRLPYEQFCQLLNLLEVGC